MWSAQSLNDRGTSYILKIALMIAPDFLLKAHSMSMKVAMANPHPQLGLSVETQLY